MGVRVLVVGAGAIGGLIAGRLAANPRLEVCLALRSPRPPLTITRGSATVTPPVTQVLDPAAAGKASWIIVATKVTDVHSIGPWLDAGQSSETRMVVAQNGVEHAERLAGRAPVESIVPAIVTHGVARSSVSEVIHTLDGEVLVPNSPHGRAFVEISRGTGLDVRATPEFGVALWSKLAQNLVGSSLTTITGLRPDQLGRSGELRPLAVGLVDECRAVAATQGVELSEDLAERLLAKFATHSPEVRSSMWQDLQAGRPLEHDAISGALGRIATAHGLAAPLSEAVTQILAAMSARTDR